MRVIRDDPRFERSGIAAGAGLVLAQDRRAAQAGALVLERGGNAVDAAVAASFVLFVTEPFMSSPCGHGALVVHDAKTGATGAIDMSARSPSGATARMWDLDPDRPAVPPFGFAGVKGDANFQGGTSVAVPGAAAGLLHALERHGTWQRRDVIAPAIELARSGFDATWYYSAFVTGYSGPLRQAHAAAEMFLPGGDPPWPALSPSYPARRITFPDLATTLETLAAEGARALHGGELGSRIARCVAAGGGAMREEDLARWTPESGAGLRARYRDVEVVVPDGPTGGATLLQILRVLDGRELSRLAPGSAEHLHVVAEAMRGAFADRLQRLGDRDGGAGHTTHVTAADASRNAVSVTLTLGTPFGSRVVVPGTGLLLNNLLHQFDPVPGRPNSIGPWRRPLWNGTPAIVLRDGKPVLAVGSVGARQMISAVLQVIVNVVDFGLDVQEAISSPRLHCDATTTTVDSRVGAKVIDELSALGHRVRAIEEDILVVSLGRPSAIRLDGAGLRGGLDPFRPGGWAGVE